MGLETKLCFNQIPPNQDPIYLQSAAHMQGSCVGASPWPFIRATDFVQEGDDLFCIWVNNDNCDECSRRTGLDCTNDRYLFWANWNCWDERLPPAQRLGCTGIAGRETRVSWFDARIPPPSPNFRVWAQDNSVHLYWNDKSEFAWDFEVEMVDFESYRIWRADNWERPLGTSIAIGPGTDLWTLIAEFDLVDMFDPIGSDPDELVPLGQNTGLEVVSYRPSCLDDPTFDGLTLAMQSIVDSDVEGRFLNRPSLRDNYGRPRPGLEALLPWESYPSVIDTFFWVATRQAEPGVVPKRGQKFYEYVDEDVHNGFLYFYSVTATDRHIEYVGSQAVNRDYGISGSPNLNFAYAKPVTDAQTLEERQRDGVNIYVYPNPATREALAEYQQFVPNKDDPTGIRISFANLPEAHNRIRIFTASGDLVEELFHDGTGGEGQISWNLISRNGQEVVSGIYLYVVESDSEGFDNFSGRFVVVR
jgi:hypothetical protein